MRGSLVKRIALRWGRARKRPPYLFLAPFLVLYALFWLVPIVKGFELSVFRQSVAGFGFGVVERNYEFVGLDNYVRLFTHPLYRTSFLKAISNTFLYMAGTILTVIPASLGLSLLLKNTFPRLRGLVRILLFMPTLMPPAILAYVYVVVFSGENGLLNRLLLSPLGLPNIDWLTHPDYIKPALVIFALWRWTGFITLFMWAGLDGIPRHYYDLAQTEGATAWQTFWRVTLPLMRPILLFAVLFMVFDAFVLFSGAFVLLNDSGGTQDAGLLLVTFIYRTGFTFPRDVHLAAAASFLIAPVLFLSVWLFTLARRSDA